MKTHYNLVCTKKIVCTIEKELRALQKSVDESTDPDSFGIFDSYEQIVGMGFAVCQTFLVSACMGNNKMAPLNSPPYHSCGKSYALITNACANYWKHNGEWERSRLSKQANITIEIIGGLGVDIWSSYPLSQTIQTLDITDEQGFFSGLLDKLNKWAVDITIKG